MPKSHNIPSIAKVFVKSPILGGYTMGRIWLWDKAETLCDSFVLDTSNQMLITLGKDSIGHATQPWQPFAIREIGTPMLHLRLEMTSSIGDSLLFSLSAGTQGKESQDLYCFPWLVFSCAVFAHAILSRCLQTHSPFFFFWAPLCFQHMEPCRRLAVLLHWHQRIPSSPAWRLVIKWRWLPQVSQNLVRYSLTAQGIY